MCSLAKLFDKNIRKFDAKKTFFFLLWVVYKLVVLEHFAPWDILDILDSIIRQEKLLKLTKIFNYIKSLCIIFCVKMSWYSQSIYIIHKKELKHFGLKILVSGIPQHFELSQVFMYNSLC